MAKLRSIAKHHKLAVAEAVAARGESPLVGPSNTAALPAPEQKKLQPKRAKRKAPRVVSEDEADESTEDGLTCKRKRGAATATPAAEVAPPP